MDLLSSIWLVGVANVLGFGAKKYAAHNWRKGIAQSRLIGAALRHLLAHNSGEDRDPESGLLHLDHASCCLMFARELWETRPDLDDRYGAKARDKIPCEQGPSLPEEAEKHPRVCDTADEYTRDARLALKLFGEICGLRAEGREWLFERLAELQLKKG